MSLAFFPPFLGRLAAVSLISGYLEGCLQIKLENQRESLYVYRGTATDLLILMTTLEGGEPCLTSGKSRLREVK